MSRATVQRATSKLSRFKLSYTGHKLTGESGFLRAAFTSAKKLTQQMTLISLPRDAISRNAIMQDVGAAGQYAADLEPNGYQLF
ncbi:hypothetical protein NKJ90_32120 [Mesorhizobium sp. M0051]|uniref:hypothetical protein n=1 Tax=Mesorhizobium sp. M0051 TaxID=2956862 RepID=UPI003335398C